MKEYERRKKGAWLAAVGWEEGLTIGSTKDRDLASLNNEPRIGQPQQQTTTAPI